MAHVIDLAGEDAGAEVLERTDADGFLGPDHLVAEPLASRLADDEAARYLLRNAKAGVTIAEGGDERHLEPDGDYQAFALLTDRRLLFVAGAADGDLTFTLPLADVLEVTVESAGIRAERLVVETADGRRVTFPCRGDLEDVAEIVADDAAVWSHAERRHEDADEALELAREALADGDHETALDALDEATSAWREAASGVESVHEAAVAWMRERIADRWPVAVSLRRRAQAATGASAHAAALDAWDDGDYERAATAYERAFDAYAAAIDAGGDEPSDEGLRRRLTAAAREREFLRVGPLIDAHAARERAERIADPGDAAEAWERALERYRGTLELEWGETGREFAIDREAVRAHAAEAAEAAVDERCEVAGRWITAGDTLATNQDVADAARLYDRAERHLESARELAEEVQPGRIEGIDRQLRGIEDRRAGRIDPADVPKEGPMPVDSLVEALEVLGDDVDFGAGPAPAVSRREEAGAAGAGPANVASVPAGDGRASQEADEGQPVGDEDGRPGTGAADRDRAGLAEAVGRLADAAFTELVGEVWAARGWATTVFTSGAASVYDVLGVRDDEHLLLWTIHRPPDGTVGPAVVERCATTCERSRGADRAALVTAGSLTAAAAERAGELGVETVDGEELVALLEETGLAARIA